MSTIGPAAAQNRRPEGPGQPAPTRPTAGDSSQPQSPGRPGLGAASQRPGPKPYKEVITPKALTKKGLFTVHKIEDKYYFEIPDSIFGRDIMAITRFSKVVGGAGIYGGELANQQVIRWEKGPDNKTFLRVITVINVANDSTQPIYKAVRNSNLDPIAAAFDVKSLGKDSSGVVLDMSEFLKGDNMPVSLGQSIKRRLNLGGLTSDRSYIESIRTFPINTEVQTVKTYSASAGGGLIMGPSPFPGSSSIPAASAAGSITVETNTSFILMPSTPMRKRPMDNRVGYFGDDYTVYSDDQQKVYESRFIVRWRLEPKPADRERWTRGELVEPAKPIIYYIDPATPKKWRPYLIQGVNDWQKAFEKAGFKNAIIGQDWPEKDSTMSLEDARYSVIRYFASDIQNAYGPNVHDPRSGEIIESHIGWYHNVMKLVHDWYFVQTAAVDSGARHMTFDDDLMGNLIRFVSSHEVGHTLGLRHNMGSSSMTPVEKLRDKAWVEANGHTASIMDYARFNYVAQPEDSIGRKGLFPRIGDYDKWAIEWGYGPVQATDEASEKNELSQKFVARYRDNPRIWFGTYESGNTSDPRTQSEDLGDNAMKASEYGIRNLKRIVPNLMQWTREDADNWSNLAQMYSQVVGQFNRYMNHVARNVGGYYETWKSVEQEGAVFEATPRQHQKDAVVFLHRQLFETPVWLTDAKILDRISAPLSNTVGSLQESLLGSMLSAARLDRMVQSANRFPNTYAIDEFYADLRKGIFSELATGKRIENLRRNLQKAYVERMIALIAPAGTPAPPSSMGGFTISLSPDMRRSDVSSLTRAHLASLRSEIMAAVSRTSDSMSRYHLQDLSERIRNALDPK
ncbi:MAG: zinc-dependent metalloprotease [Bacteroidetes bacterium]|nr:zinc-dependent metalloprotease [Bacteroidota bacterium]